MNTNLTSKFTPEEFMTFLGGMRGNNNKDDIGVRGPEPDKEDSKAVDGSGDESTILPTREHDGSGALDDSVEEVDRDEGISSQCRTDEALSPNPGETLDSYMQRLRLHSRSIYADGFVEDSVSSRKRSNSRRNSLPSVQPETPMDAIIHGIIRSRGDSETDEDSLGMDAGDKSSGLRERKRIEVPEGMDIAGFRMVDRTKEESDSFVPVLFEDSELNIETKVVNKSDNVRVATGFLPTQKIPQKDFYGWSETYEASFDVDVNDTGIVVPTDSILSRMGGKKMLKTWLIERFPRRVNTYVEPFGGSFQVLLWKPWRDRIEIINDLDADLVHFFKYVVFDPDKLVNFINSLPTHEAILLGFRESLARGELSGLERAGAYYCSVSSAFNAMGFSHGRYASSPHVLLDTRVDKRKLFRVAERLRGVDIRSTTYDRLLSSAVKNIHGGLFVYLDPPYDQTETYSSFQGSLGFGWEDHVRLAEYCKQIHEFGGKFIQTNSATDRLKDLYGSIEGFYIKKLSVYYSVSGKAETRSSQDEYVISNFDLTDSVSDKQQARLF